MSLALQHSRPANICEDHFAFPGSTKIRNHLNAYHSHDLSQSKRRLLTNLLERTDHCASNVLDIVASLHEGPYETSDRITRSLLTITKRVTHKKPESKPLILVECPPIIIAAPALSTSDVSPCETGVATPKSICSEEISPRYDDSIESDDLPTSVYDKYELSDWSPNKGTGQNRVHNRAHMRVLTKSLTSN